MASRKSPTSIRNASRYILAERRLRAREARLYGGEGFIIDGRTHHDTVSRRRSSNDGTKNKVMPPRLASKRARVVAGTEAV